MRTIRSRFWRDSAGVCCPSSTQIFVDAFRHSIYEHANLMRPAKPVELSVVRVCMWRELVALDKLQIGSNVLYHHYSYMRSRMLLALS